MIDASYAPNGDDRKSISGTVTSLGGTIVSWSSTTQKTVTLSSCESEYVALASAAKELLFIQSLLGEFNSAVLPGIMFEDNMGAIFLVRNSQVGQRTKHIDIRAHFLRDIKRDGKMDVEHIKTDNNEADVCTKNTIERLLTKHVENMRAGRLYCWRHWDEIMEKHRDNGNLKSGAFEGRMS